MKLPIALLLSSCLFGCGSSGTPNGPNPPKNPVPIDEVIHGMAIIQVSAQQSDMFSRLMSHFFPVAYAATGTTTVTYTNSPNTTFTLDVSSLAPNFTPTFTGSTLNLGNVTVSALSDNNLKVCNPGGNTKCTTATIQVYTTGSVAGFVNTADSYGAPVYTGTLNPTTQIGLNTAGAVAVQTFTIGSTVHRLTLADFPSPTYAVTSDFSNAGAGSYSMTYVVQYALSP